MHPRTVSLAAAGIRGTWRQVEERRGVLELLGFGGLRPSEICAERHSWWRDAHGPKRFMTVSSAIKIVAGQLHEGEPKTGTRDIYLFEALAEQLERIYQAQGYPSLNALIAPVRLRRIAFSGAHPQSATSGVTWDAGRPPDQPTRRCNSRTPTTGRNCRAEEWLYSPDREE